MAEDAPDDPYRWLEEVQGGEALSWVEARNAATVAELQGIGCFDEILADNRRIYDSKEKIPGVAIRGGFLYNFWQDGEHVRGLWRRTRLESYRSEAPAWEVVLDLDALARDEGESWVFQGATCLEPDGDLCMVGLSRGGGDAVVYREMDLRSRHFVEGGFLLPEAKSSVSWRDRDHLFVGTDFGEGSLTSSGYPRLAKLWQRGASLGSAPIVLEGRKEDVTVAAYSVHTPEGRYDLAVQAPEFFKTVTYLILDRRPVRLDLPDDASLQGFFQDQLLVFLRTEWAVGGHRYPAGALLAVDLDDFLRGSRELEVLFEPGARVAFGGLARARDELLVQTLDNVRGRLFRLQRVEGRWARRELPLPGLGTVDLAAASPFASHWFFSYDDFLTPESLLLVQGDLSPEVIKTTPAWFDAKGMAVFQHEATSPDGTHVPYFVVTPEGFVADATSPTLLYGYGGFEVPELPAYSGVIGTAWLARGGVYVVANIRGGGEFGPTWHQAARRENRQRAFDDFIAVAEDLVRRRITSPAHLGIMGGSNGGLLVAVAFLQRPELFRAVVSSVPLLDMRRYHKLLAGASWVAEYGNPDDPADWEFLKGWSPYHMVQADVRYPRVFFFTSTRDDRVHPGHARKMVARMTELGHDVLYWENTEGGHAGAADNEQRARMWAYAYAYLWKTLR